MRIVSLAALALLLAAAEARAQFTTYVEPPRRERKSVASAILEARQRARADSLRRAAIAEMKAWVDSAAAALQAGGADSARAPRPRPDTSRVRPDTSAARIVAAPLPRGARPSSIRANQYIERPPLLLARRARA